MNRRRARWMLLVLGGACMVGYMLTALRGVSPSSVRLGGVLLYVGISLLLAGLVLRLPGTKGGRRHD